MSSSALPPAAQAVSLSPMFLPHEIFLLIVEAIIDDAEARAFDQPMAWWLHAFARHATEQFTIFSMGDMHSRRGEPPALPNRTSNSTLRISEVNGHAFRMVHRRFCRLPYWYPFARSPHLAAHVSYVWAHPKIDVFHPMIEFISFDFRSSLIRLDRTVIEGLLHQSPRGAQATAHMQNIVFAPVLRQREDMELHSRALQRMPNLKVLHLGMRMAVETLPKKFCRPGVVIPVDAPEVGQIQRYLAKYEAFWVPFMERGVRVILDGQTFDPDRTRYFLDLFREEDGLYLRHLDPESYWFKLRSALEIPT